MYKAYFFIRVDRYFIKISIDEIIYIEARASYISIVTDRQQHTVLFTLKQLEKKLPQDHFCRIHRSIIVAINRITSFDDFHVMLGERRFPLGKSYQKTLLDKVTILQTDDSNQSTSQTAWTSEDGV